MVLKLGLKRDMPVNERIDRRGSFQIIVFNAATSRGKRMRNVHMFQLFPANQPLRRGDCRMALLLCGTIIGMSGFQGTAFAQTAAATPVAEQTANNGLAEIVVTAERRSANLQAVPVAVTALDQSALANAQIHDTQDLMTAVPALRLTTNVTGPSDLQPAMRGAVEQNGGSIPTESPIGIYIDDVFVSSLIANNSSLADIERVEVLRGPQGTLYGRNTLTGAIKFVTRTPGETPWVRAEASYGNYNQYFASASVGAPLADGLAGSISANFNGHDGYYDNIATAKRAGDENGYALHGKVHYYGTEKLDVVLNMFYAHDRNDGQIETPATPNFTSTGQFNLNDLNLTAGGPYKTNTPINKNVFGAVGANTFGLTRQVITSLTTSYDFGNMTLKSITAYTNTKQDLTVDLCGCNGIILGGIYDMKQFTQELQAIGTAMEGKLHYIAGAFYMNQHGDQEFGWLAGVPLSKTFTSVKTISYAVYGQIDYDIAKNFTATVGLRALRDEKSFTTSLVGLVVPSSGPVALKNKYSTVTPKAQISYHIDHSGILDSGLIYASATRGFKPGGYNSLNVVNLDQASSPYGPETVWSYEGGVKLDFAGHRVRTNVAVFSQDISGLQLGTAVVASNGSVSFPVQNSGTERVYGLELDFTAKPFDGLLIGVNGSFLGGNYKNVAAGSAAANALIKYGKSVPPLLAPYSISLNGSYEIALLQISNDAHIRVGGDLYLSGKYLTGADNASFVNAYTRSNAYLAFSPSRRLEFRLAVKNLTKEVTFTTGSTSLGGYTVLPPRQLLFTVKYGI